MSEPVQRPTEASDEDVPGRAIEHIKADLEAARRARDGRRYAELRAELEAACAEVIARSRTTDPHVRAARIRQGRATVGRLVAEWEASRG